MPPEIQNRLDPDRQILSGVPRRDFVGHSGELDRILNLALGREFARGILMASEPGVGSSELLRQAFDAVFETQRGVVPIYFPFPYRDTTVTSIAQQFLHAALLHYISYRRANPGLCKAVLSVGDLLDLALPADAEWVEKAIVSSERERTGGNEGSYVRSCLSVLRRMKEAGVKTLLLLDDVHHLAEFEGGASIADEFARAALSFTSSFVFSGLRRVIVEQFSDTPELLDNSVVMRIEQLDPEHARLLAERASRRFGISLNDQTRDLVAQEFGGRPLFMTSFLHAAAENSVPLTSFRECQQLYLNEVMGGRVNRYFNGLFDRLSLSPSVRRNLTRVLFESRLIDNGKISIDVLRRRLEVDASLVEHIVRGLNAFELVAFSTNFLEVNGNSLPWLDYLHTRYRLEVSEEPRALVFADTLLDLLKRAPQTMARHYRREASLGLQDTLRQFNCQRLPASLFHYDRFKRAYKGAEEEEIISGLDAEVELIRLPQVVHVASCAAFDPGMQQHCDEERCAVAHGFEAASYSDSNEIIWLAIEIESKLEVGRGVTEVWCDRLTAMARSCGFTRVRLWLVTPEGFSDEALAVLNERNVFNSSRQQFELISSKLQPETVRRAESAAIDEFEMVIPMGDDSELIAAHTVEQIARRMNFGAEEINQIKTALVEACINAAEHSLSPDRKIYQQFRLESDKLVVTVSSRGVVPASTNGQKPPLSAIGAPGDAEGAKGRRGWGLQLIQSLMDEVEFETVDDGTRLKMTKYVKKG
jgi:serine/threonine-protein kinase RsbW